MATIINNTLKVDTLNFNGVAFTLPPSDDNYYVFQNGAWVPTIVCEAPEDWLPAINNSETITITVDADLQTWQLTGSNVEVNV